MPSVSKKQAAFMRAAAHNKKFAEKARIEQSVAKEFVDADKKDSKTKAMIKKRYGRE